MHLRTLLFPALCTILALCAPPIAKASGNKKAAEEAGAVLFHDKGCVQCHGAAGTGTKKGPDLSQIRKDELWTLARITDQILNGGQKMPPFADSVTDQEAALLAAFLRAKRKPEPPAK